MSSLSRTIALFLLVLLVCASGSVRASGFTDNQDGTVTDSASGLIWLKNASCFKVVFNCGTQPELAGDPMRDCASDSFREALEINAQLGSAAADDEREGLQKALDEIGWRLPSEAELQSLLQRIARAEVPFEDVMLAGDIRNQTREGERRLLGEFQLGYYLHNAGGYCRLGAEPPAVECAGSEVLCQKDGPYVLKSWSVRAGS